MSLLIKALEAEISRLIRLENWQELDTLRDELAANGNAHFYIEAFNSSVVKSVVKTPPLPSID